MPTAILPHFGFDDDDLVVKPFGTGLINHTWKVETGGRVFILQRINDAVFRKPQDIAVNLELMADYLRRHHPDYLFVAPIPTTGGNGMMRVDESGYFRVFPFVDGSHSIDVVMDVKQAYEAAKQFGRFTKLLSGFDARSLRVTIPSFHDLGLRKEQFDAALAKGNPARIKESAEWIERLQAHSQIADVFKRIQSDPEFRLRVTHHDTKISNVLFDEEGQGLCVIDLDTVMPGYFISDFGDMMRTYLSPVSEEERDLAKITVREEYFKAILDGYLGEMREELTSSEKEHLIYAGKFMIYMQALRFLTDHLNDDIYYGAKYAGHNLSRARNQLQLLEKLIEKEGDLLKYC